MRFPELLIVWTICGTRANGNDERQDEKGRA